MEPDLRDMLVRIDERTASTHKLLEQHIEHDREDFEAVHSRVGRVERELGGKLERVSVKQSWIVGVGTGLGMIGTAVGFVIAWFKTGGGSGT
jgi:hypothetical protein